MVVTITSGKNALEPSAKTTSPANKVEWLCSPGPREDENVESSISQKHGLLQARFPILVFGMAGLKP